MFRFALVSGALGVDFVSFAVHPSRLSLAVLAVGCVFVLVLLVDFFLVDAERLLGRALKASRVEDHDALLKKAGRLAIRESQRCRGAERAKQLLTLAKVRRQQGLQEAARDAAECGLDIISELYGHGELRMELTYQQALIDRELKYEASAITILERIVAVPHHELSPLSVKTQLKACELLIELLTKAGYEGSIPAVIRRAELLRDDV